MANYKAAEITGTQWQRCHNVSIINKYGDVPTIIFYEETLVELADGKTVSSGGSFLSETFSNPAQVFNLIDPSSDEVLGTASYQDVYVILNSLYRALAAARDAAA